MHLGRFHATIYDLAEHFKKADLVTKLEQCASLLDNYSSTRDQSHLESFKNTLKNFFSSANIKDPDLQQPYALQIIEDLSIENLLSPNINKHVQLLVTQRSFDHVALAVDLRNFAQEINKKISQISNIDTAFSELKVEFQRVEGNEAEVGIMLPRQIVGETLKDLTSEFGELAKLFRAINELTAAQDYDPKVRTISSSWWQVFLELDATQIAAWTVAIERIVTLFKTNLEIKNLQLQLSSMDIPEHITKLIEEEIETRVNSEIEKLATDIRTEHAKIDDQHRLNEIENQLRHGLRYLAKRINQGAQVEINVAIPAEPKEPQPAPDGTPPAEDLLEKNTAQRARIEELRKLRERGRAASVHTLSVDTSAQLLIDKDDEP